MMQIDAARKSPLEQLAADYLVLKGQPSIDFCCRTLGVPEDDAVIARRLDVAIAAVRAWREVGRRTNGRCGWSSYR